MESLHMLPVDFSEKLAWTLQMIFLLGLLLGLVVGPWLQRSLHIEQGLNETQISGLLQDLVVSKPSTSKGQIVVYHESRKDLLDLQVSKWTHSGFTIVPVKGSLLDALRAAGDTSVFVHASYMFPVEVADIFFGLSKQRASCIVSDPDDLKKPWALHKRHLHPIVLEALSERLEQSFKNCKNLIDSEIVVETLQSLAVPFMIVQNQYPLVSLTHDAHKDMFAHKIDCLSQMTP